MSGWGTSEWGTSGWGTGAGVGTGFLIDWVRAIDGNTVRIAYTEDPQRQHDRLPEDALNPRNYTIALVAGPVDTWTPRVARCFTVVSTPPVAADSRQVDLRLYQGMPGIFRTRQTQFRVTVTNVRSFNGDPLAGSAFRDFYSLNNVMQETTLRLKESTGRDIANSPTPNSPMGGTFRVTASGDYEFDSGLKFVKKLIFRRLLTPPGGFFWMPGYGMGLKPKSLKVPWRLTLAKNEMPRQIIQEPEVIECDVSVTLNVSGLVIFWIKAKTKQGLDMSMRLTVQPDGSVLTA